MRKHIILLLILLPMLSWAKQPTVAFFYGENPPMQDLRAFDWVVVEPGHLTDPTPYQHPESQVFAYVSLGEVSPDKPYLSAMPTAWLKGKNEGWQSLVIDQTADGWVDFAIEKLFTPLWQAGYRGFFLDTLDAFNLIAKTDAERNAQAAGLTKVIAALKAKYPSAKLIFNRGFEILPQAHQWADAVAFESWLSGYDANTKQYRDVSDADRNWLSGQLAQVKSWQIPIIAIDYTPPQARDKARQIALQLQQAGFIPWVSNPDLTMLGVGSIEIAPRRILMVTSPVQDELDYHFSPNVTYPTAILNAMGYAVDYAPINRPLPSTPLIGRYAGIIIFLANEKDSNTNAQFPTWLTQLKQQKLPLLLMGDISYMHTNKSLANLFAIKMGEGINATHLSILKQTSEIGFETQPMLDRLGFFPLNVANSTETWLSFKDDQGQVQEAVALTDWGGVAITPHLYYTMETNPAIDYWVTNPYALFERGLQLTPMPLPDTTTENGKRLFMVHHDGDGFATRAEIPGAPFASQVMLDEIVKKYPIPMSLSVIEGETSPTGLYPKESPQLEQIAKAMFAQPNVEIASHTYSHPFSWGVVSGARNTSNLYQEYNLPIPNYHATMQREVQGAIDYINQRLAPKDKKVVILNWSGDCNPGKDALDLVKKAHIVSVNGGDTMISDSKQSLTRVGPVGLNKDGDFQVYAPNQNENVYTNNWNGPFYGYVHVLETYKRTDQPRRIKPVDIYFHTYALSKKASIDALKKVFNWAMQQPFNPVYMSEYAHKAQEFNDIVIAKTSNQQWIIRGLSSLQELRIPQSMGYPDFNASPQIIGFNDYNDQRYLHAAGTDIQLALTPQKPTQAYLIDANGQAAAFQRNNNGFKLTLTSYVEPKFRVQSDNCALKINRNGSTQQFTEKYASPHARHVTTQIEAICRP